MGRILITGTSGFIGSRLAKRSAQAGHDVIATARQPSTALEHDLGLSVLPLDVLDEALPERRIEAEVLVHCATANDIVSKNFSLGMSLSVTGTRNVLEMAVKNGIQNIIFFSTLQVYGTELSGFIAESTPTHCETPYGLNHALGEELCRMYARNHGLNIVLARPSNVYGVPDAETVNRSTLVPMCFVKTALAEGKLTLNSSGRQQRNFVSTDEVAEACLHLFENFPSGATVINIGSHWQASIREIAHLVAQAYEAHLGMPLPFEILSNNPERGNDFVLGSSLDFLRPTVEESHARMASVIRQLFVKSQSQP